jgi:predicted transcriptional regulator
VFTVRDFNSQVMAMTFDAAAREGLGEVLDELVASGLLERRAPTEYSLTDNGVAFVRDRRAARR